jgi:hypothetical protein
VVPTNAPFSDLRYPLYIVPLQVTNLISVFHLPWVTYYANMCCPTPRLKVHVVAMVVFVLREKGNAPVPTFGDDVPKHRHDVNKKTGDQKWNVDAESEDRVSSLGKCWPRGDKVIVSK